MARLRAGRCWTLLTTLRQLDGHEEPSGPKRELGTQHGATLWRKSWGKERSEQRKALGHEIQPYCLIVGGGQGGIALAARLKRLNVPTLVIEKNARAGDSWRNRYQSLCLHDPVWYNHLPYIPFPDHWPVFTPKDKLGDWLEAYVQAMDLDYWTSTICEGARFDDSRGAWEVNVLRDGQPMVLRPQHLIFALGVSGFPRIPDFPGAASFRGVQLHSSEYKDGSEFEGKQCVVVGANNSAHDVCADLWEHGVSVSMIQRSSTLVVRSETFMKQVLGDLYTEGALSRGITTDRADTLMDSFPFKVMAEQARPVWTAVVESDRPFYDRLRKAGFQLDFGVDGSGLSLKYLRRGSGYYIDVGASDLIASQRVALYSNVNVSRILEDGLELSDGRILKADAIIYATGYGAMDQWVQRLLPQDLSRRIGRCWGLGSDTPGDPGPWKGELRNMWKPMAHHRLWLHGGNLRQSRFYSQFLALQIKARMEGLGIAVYGEPDQDPLDPT